MKTLEHTFPLPEVEAHKLDDFQHQFESPAPSLPAQADIKTLLPLIVVTGLGLVAGWLWSRRSS